MPHEVLDDAWMPGQPATGLLQCLGNREVFCLVILLLLLSAITVPPKTSHFSEACLPGILSRHCHAWERMREVAGEMLHITSALPRVLSLFLLLSPGERRPRLLSSAAPPFTTTATA